MKRFNLFLLIFILLIAAPVFAAKNETESLKKGDFGLIFYTGLPLISEGYIGGNNASAFRAFGAGAIIHLSQSFALEPGIFFQKYNREYEDGGTTSDRTYLGLSAGIFYYGNLNNNMYFYTGPRLEYGYGKRNSSGSSDEKISENDYGISAVFGLKYMLSSRFGLFADVGLGFYLAKEDDNTSSNGVETSTSFCLTRGMLGVVFYL